ncbi:P-loop containing nucleoside triphosphate hydrolase protein [Spinellus fusiger]|nr:P-loop containing nucleoside triphosphate hydrolase protein [Spinellus fusiger]
MPKEDSSWCRVAVFIIGTEEDGSVRYWRTDTDEVHPHGMVDPAWLYDIIGHYGGRSFPSPQGTLLPSFLMTATVHPHQPLPTLHLGWVLSLLAQSVQQWPNAYTASLPSLVSLLLHLLSDPATQPITDTLHHTLHTCLVTLPSPWKSKLHSIVHALEPASMLPMLQAFLPVDSRAVYLQRALAASALGLVSFHLDTLLGLLQDPTSVFCATPIDYPGLVTMTRLMDIAIGSNEHQFQDNKSQVREYLYKILVVGDLGTGKTSIIRRYVHNIFSSNYKSTIGVDFALKVIQWSPEIIVRLQLWDIAGQERFGNMTRVYYKEALGAFVVYDVTRPQTFEGVTKWKHDIDSKVTLPEAWGGGSIPVILLANKSDLIQQGHGQQVNKEDMDRFCAEQGFLNWFETSAKEDMNIDEAARHLMTAVLKIEEEHGSDGLQQEDSVRLDQGNKQERGGCC